MNFEISNTNRISKIFRIIKASEEVVSTEGIYIGKTTLYSLPFFINPSLTVNPHIMILGMTGSGKTYLMKTLALRTLIYTNNNISIIDWNGEYVNSLEPFLISFGTRINLLAASNISHLNSFLFNINKNFYRKLSENLNHLLFVDEAWKLSNNKILKLMLREGRKYGFGVVMATQLAKDIANEAISNAANIVIFKLQNKEDFEILMRSGIISSAERRKISEMPVGTCLFLQRYKNNPEKISRIFVKVDALSSNIFTIKSDKMEYKINADLFISHTNALDIDANKKHSILDFIEKSERFVDLGAFIEYLISLDLHREEIVPYIREFGINDLSIINAYNSINRVEINV
ncbi:MAG: ATP-binding protein [Candidatus Micrarchaeaceae archaeon]